MRHKSTHHQVYQGEYISTPLNLNHIVNTARHPVLGSHRQGQGEWPSRAKTEYAARSNDSFVHKEMRGHRRWQPRSGRE